MKCFIAQHHIDFTSYRYPGASVSPRGIIQAAVIEEIDINAAPPALKLKDELIYVSAKMRTELHAFAKTNSIPLIDRFDVWGAILEPFVDTEYDREYLERVSAQLEEHGIDRALTERLRKTYGSIMLRYNSLMWDYHHLGHYDLLEAMKYSITGLLHYRKHYHETMAFALLSYRDTV